MLLVDSLFLLKSEPSFNESAVGYLGLRGLLREVSVQHVTDEFDVLLLFPEGHRLVFGLIQLLSQLLEIALQILDSLWNEAELKLRTGATIATISNTNLDSFLEFLL